MRMRRRESRGQWRIRWSEEIFDWTSVPINMAVRVTAYRHRWHYVQPCSRTGIRRQRKTRNTTKT